MPLKMVLIHKTAMTSDIMIHVLSVESKALMLMSNISCHLKYGTCSDWTNKEQKMFFFKIKIDAIHIFSTQSHNRRTSFSNILFWGGGDPSTFAVYCIIELMIAFYLDWLIDWLIIGVKQRIANILISHLTAVNIYKSDQFLLGPCTPSKQSKVQIDS